MADLRTLQLMELDILKAVHEACEKLGLRYYIMYGTLLGAVRHHGFIPWDDDIDICMPREDYERFVREAQAYLPENFTIQHYLTEEECPNIFAKVRNKNTVYMSPEHKNLNINQGIFIDVFPLDMLPDDIKPEKEYQRRQRFLIIKNCYETAYVDTIIRKSSKLIAKLIRGLLIKGVYRNLSRHDFIAREDEKRIAQHKKGGRLCMISDFDYMSIYPYAEIMPRRLFDFEGEKFWGPENYDAMLTHLYGDYMVLPKEADRVQHEAAVVDLEQGINK